MEDQIDGVRGALKCAIGSGHNVSMASAGVLFDVDGTLVDSNYLHTVAWWQAFGQQDLTVEMSAIHRAIGMGGDRLMTHLVGEDVAGRLGSAISAAHGALFATYWPALAAFDGAKELLEQCHAVGLTVVLASSAQRRQLEAMINVIDASDAITATTSSSDAQNSKPAPDILQAALAAGEIEHAVFVGDAVWDVRAASAMGIGTIALTCGGTSAAELREAGAAQTYEGPRALLDDFENSLLGGLLGGS